VKDVFAVIGDGIHEYPITVWPSDRVPFPLHMQRALCIRVFTAKDGASFGLNAAEEVMICFLPLWRVLEVVPAVSTQGVAELWLSLGVPCPLALRTDCAIYLDSSGDMSLEAMAAVDEHFERSRQLAASNPHSPRMRIIVQGKQEIAVAMSAMVRQGAQNMTSPRHLEFLGNATAPDASGAWSSIAPSRMPTALDSHSAAGFHSPGHAVRDAVSPLSMVNVPPLSSPSPKSTTEISPTACSSDGKPGCSGDLAWRARWEDERQKHDDNRKKYSKQLQAAKAAAAQCGQMLLAMGVLLERHTLRWCKTAALITWRYWATGEKHTARFERLADDDAQIQDLRCREMNRLDTAIKDAHTQLSAHRARLKRHLQRRNLSLEPICGIWDEDVAGQLLTRTLCCWRARASQRVLQRRICDERGQSASREVICAALCKWCALVGQRRLEAFQLRVKIAEVEVPTLARRNSTARLLRVFSWTDEGKCPNAGSTGLLDGALVAWVRITRSRAWHRERVMQLFRSRAWADVGHVFAVCCLVSWRGAVSKMEAALTVERSTTYAYILRCRERAVSILEAADGARDAGGAHAVLLCWYFLAARRKLRHPLENVFATQQNDKERYDHQQAELDELRMGLLGERARWEHERGGLLARLRLEELELREGRTAFQEVAEDCKLVKHQMVAATDRTQRLVSELASAQAETVQTSQELRMTRESCEFAESSLHDQEAMYEEECASARLHFDKVQADAARLREKRQRDIKAQGQQLRNQLLRHEDAVQRLSRGHEDDQATWAQKLRQSEARASRLQNEATQARRNLQGIPARTEAYEAENAELLLTCEDAEGRLRKAEGAGRARREEIASLRSAREVVRMRSSEFELECAHALKGMSPHVIKRGQGSPRGAGDRMF